MEIAGARHDQYCHCDDDWDRRRCAGFEPSKKQALEGAYTRIVYLIPENRSPLEVVRNYEEAIKSAGGNVLYQCKESECGGNASSSTGGGGGLSLAMYLYPPKRVTEEHHTTGHCAVSERITEQRYVAAELPQSAAHVSVLTGRAPRQAGVLMLRHASRCRRLCFGSRAAFGLLIADNCCARTGASAGIQMPQDQKCHNLANETTAFERNGAAPCVPPPDRSAG